MSETDSSHDINIQARACKDTMITKDGCGARGRKGTRECVTNLPMLACGRWNGIFF